MARTAEFAICVIGIYACFLTWGLTQERVSTTQYNGARFKNFIFLNATQAAIASLVGKLYINLRGSKLEKLDRKVFLEYLQLSLLHCLASPFGYAALKHIDYPTVILGKACKLIPVMLMGFVLYRKVYTLQKYSIVMLISTGVSLFMFLSPTSKKSTSSSSLYGIGLLMVNLLIDGATNSTQDQMFRTHRMTGTSMMMYMNAFSSILMVIYLALSNPWTNELGDALSQCFSNYHLAIDILIFGLAGAIGQCFIFHTLEHFGSIVLVTVTVTRKMFSMILSVLYFGHSLNLGQWFSVGLVFSGIIWESSVKMTPKTSKTVDIQAADEIKAPARRYPKRNRKNVRKSDN